MVRLLNRIGIPIEELSAQCAQKTPDAKWVGERARERENLRLKCKGKWNKSGTGSQTLATQSRAYDWTWVAPKSLADSMSPLR